MSDRNTNTEHEDIHTSMAFTYDTGGRSCWDCVLCVAVKGTGEAYRTGYASRTISMLQSFIEDLRIKEFPSNILKHVYCSILL
jgi:hypothetical protein